MSVTFSQYNNSVTDNSSISLIAKLRRLKMQEKLMLSSINIKSDSNNVDNQHSHGFKRNILLIKLKNHYEEIKTLFDDIKYSTNSQDIINIDVEQVKKDVLSIENKIVNLKGFLHAEINNLKSKEEELMKELIENENNENKKTRKFTINKTKSFNDIVPSPVRNIINTPHKYKEVQNLQDFLKDNGGRNGGWFEYNHNLFVKIRQKYIDGIPHDKTEYETSLELFIEDLQLRIIGIGVEKIKEHEKWYLQYLKLKTAQQEVLNKWKYSRSQVRSAQHYKNNQEMVEPKSRLRKKTITKPNAEVESLKNVRGEYISNYLSNRSYDNQENENEEKLNVTKEHTASFMNTTDAWHNKCTSIKELTIKHRMNLINIPKYGVPTWRQIMLNKE